MNKEEIPVNLLKKYNETSEKLLSINKKMKLQIKELSKTKSLMNECQNCLCMQNEMLNILKLEQEKIFFVQNTFVESNNSTLPSSNGETMPTEIHKKSKIYFEETLQSKERKKMIIANGQMNETGNVIKVESMPDNEFNVIAESSINTANSSVENQSQIIQRVRTERDDLRVQQRAVAQQLLVAQERNKVLKEKSCLQIQQRVTTRQLLEAQTKAKELEIHAISPEQHRKALEQLEYMTQQLKTVLDQVEEMKIESVKWQTKYHDLDQIISSQGGLEYLIRSAASKKRASMNSKQRRNLRAHREREANSKKLIDGNHVTSTPAAPPMVVGQMLDEDQKISSQEGLNHFIPVSAIRKRASISSKQRKKVRYRLEQEAKSRNLICGNFINPVPPVQPWAVTQAYPPYNHIENNGSKPLKVPSWRGVTPVYIRTPSQQYKHATSASSIVSTTNSTTTRQLGP